MMKTHARTGFTNIELVVVIGIMLILFGISSMGIVGINQKASLNTTIDTLTSDLRDQQLKAMVGETEGRSSHDMYGVHLGTNSYTLFHGSTYSPSDPTNVSVPAGDGVELSSTFPESNIIFSSVSGELINFAEGNNTIVVQNVSSGEQKTITINSYGIIRSVD